MRPPVDHVRVSAKGKEILIKMKRRTGLEHWNEICRVALCRSLAIPTPPATPPKANEIAIDMEWKTFAGPYSTELSIAIALRARADGIPVGSRDSLAEYVRAHIERGISSLQNVKKLSEMVKFAKS